MCKAAGSKQTIVFVVNNAAYFISHRLSIGLALLAQGYRVYVLAPEPFPDELKNSGFDYLQVPMSRRGKNPLSELAVIVALSKAFQQIKPDLVHLVTIKPYLYGGIAAKIANVPAVVSAVAGLGILFSQRNFKSRALRLVLYPLYRMAFSHKKQKVIFQNRFDRDILVDWGVIRQDKTILIRGAGVDLRCYPVVPESDAKPVVSLASRLLMDKGIGEFVEASRVLKQRGLSVEFWLIGEVDPGNSNTVTQKQVDGWQQEGLIVPMGYRADIAELFGQSNVVTLPSYYGEGLPKVLIEAAACGRAVVTTDHPGCRDAIEPDSTGVLVPVRNAEALADAIQDLIENPEKRQAMGQAGRELAEREFAIEKVVDAHMVVYDELLWRDVT